MHDRSGMIGACERRESAGVAPVESLRARVDQRRMSGPSVADASPRQSIAPHIPGVSQGRANQPDALAGRPLRS